MDDILPGRTAWESRQYRHDHGRHAAAGQAFTDLGAFVTADTDGPVPLVSSVVACAATSDADDDTGCAAVDRWAHAHGLTAGWRDGTYEAVKHFGDIEYRVIYVPARTLTARAGDALPTLTEVAA